MRRVFSVLNSTWKSETRGGYAGLFFLISEPAPFSLCVSRCLLYIIIKDEAPQSVDRGQSRWWKSAKDWNIYRKKTMLQAEDEEYYLKDQNCMVLL